MIYSPRTAGTLSRLKDTTNQPLNQPADLAALAKLSTSQIPNNSTQGSASNASDAYVAQWSELLIGLRTTFSIRPLMEKYIDSGQYGFFAYLRADVQVAHPLAFVCIQGIIP